MSAIEETPLKRTQSTWREPIAVLATVILADTTIYHGAGFSGLALLVGILPLLFFFGVTKLHWNYQTFIFGGLALLTALKLLWCGNEMVLLLGLGTLFLFAAVQVGVPLYLGKLRPYATNWLIAAPLNFGDYCQWFCRQKGVGKIFEPAKQAAVLVPLGLLFVFGLIFVCANPDLQENIQICWDAFIVWLGHFSDWIPTVGQVFLWIAVVWLMLGSLRPWKIGLSAPVKPETTALETISPAEQEKTVLYYAYFNSFISLCLLFSVYLVFEFAKNWTRDFPPGFNYSQHMHDGATFLTAALALSTIVLCTVFRGKTLLDPRIRMIKRLALIWIALNFLLALAVYNRLYIYIDLNGLSQRRIAGLLGTTAVILGLVMVMRMILLGRGFRWLVYRYAWSVLAIIFIGYVFPFAWYVSHYNVSRVMKGDLAPSVFLFPRHADDVPDAEHCLASLPLLESDDEIIRDGAKAIFAKYYSSRNHGSNWGYSWTALQWSQSLLDSRLETRRGELQPYLVNVYLREQAIQKFRKYTNRWI
jgi:hypothetical protein